MEATEADPHATEPPAPDAAPVDPARVAVPPAPNPAPAAPPLFANLVSLGVAPTRSGAGETSPANLTPALTVETPDAAPDAATMRPDASPDPARPEPARPALSAVSRPTTSEAASPAEPIRESPPPNPESTAVEEVTSALSPAASPTDPRPAAGSILPPAPSSAPPPLGLLPGLPWALEPPVAAPSSPAEAAAPPPATPPLPMRQIAPIAIALAFLPGVANGFQLSLDPVELGRVEIRVQREGEAHSVRVVAERPETLALLLRDRQELDRSLADAGLRVEAKGIEFSLSPQPGPSDQRQQGEARHGMARAGTARGRALADAEPPPARAQRGLLDLNI